MKEINVILLHVVYDTYYTGIDRYIEMLQKGIAPYRHIHIHTVFLVSNKHKLFPEISCTGKRLSAVIPMPLNEELMFQKSCFWKSRCWQVITEMLAPFLKQMPGLIFHSNNTYLIDLAYALKKETGGKVLVHLHCLPWKYTYNHDIDLFRKLYTALSNRDYVTFAELEEGRINYSLSDHVICLSQVAKEYLVDIYHIPEDRIDLVRNGLDKKEPEPEQLRERQPAEILYVGKVSRDKGILELLKALTFVQRKGYRFRLTVAGTCLPEVKKYMGKTYRQLDLRILGQVTMTELQKLYATCTMGVVPSLYEQCSYVALEMAMFGVPMIVSEVDALKEMFEHEKTALLIPQGFDPDFGLCVDTERFAGHIIRLLEDKALRIKLSEQVQKHYSQNFTLQQMIDHTICVYKKML